MNHSHKKLQGLSVWWLGLAFWLVAWVPVAHAEKLLLQSNPRAVVFVDGERKGRTPLRLDLSVGRHHLELRHPKMLTWTTYFVLPSRAEMTLRVRLERRGAEGVAARTDDDTRSPRLDEPLPRQSAAEPLPKSSGLLIARSVPSGANVYQNGQLLGRTPLLINIATGTHRLRFQLEGYNTTERSINIQPAISSRLLVRMEGGSARVRKSEGDAAVQQDGQGSQTQLLVLSNPPGAKVILNGRNMGLTPIVSAGLTPGVYSLRVEAAGFSPYIRRLRLSEGQELRLKVLLIPRSKRRRAAKKKP